MSEEELKEKLQVAVDSNERHRSRARAVATLSAAAAGALAAGLVLAPPSTTTLLAHTLGLLTIIFLVLATALCTAASAVSLYDPSTKPIKRGLNYLASWRLKVDESNSKSTITLLNERISDAKVVKSGISINMNIGMWLGGLATLMLIMSISITTYANRAQQPVIVEFHSEETVTLCPKTAKRAHAMVKHSDLYDDSSYVAISLNATQCGNSRGAVLHLQRSEVTIAESPQS